MLTRQAGAKALALGASAKKDASVPAGPRRALSTLAKQEHARRMLMSNFVRGEVVGTLSISTEETDVNIVQMQGPPTETFSQDTHDANSPGSSNKDGVQIDRKKKRKRESEDTNSRSMEKKRNKRDKSTKKEKKKEKSDKKEKNDKKGKRDKKEKLAREEKRDKKKRDRKKQDKKKKGASQEKRN